MRLNSCFMFTTPLTMKSDEKRIMFMEEMRPKNLSIDHSKKKEAKNQTWSYIA
jgi:hypothetical protein